MMTFLLVRLCFIETETFTTLKMRQKTNEDLFFIFPVKVAKKPQTLEGVNDTLWYYYSALSFKDIFHDELYNLH